MSLIKQIQFDPSFVSAFGTLETAELTPVVQIDFVYGINTQTGRSAASGTGATVDTNSARLRVQSGTANGGYAYFNSKRPIRYRPGQGVTLRFTPIFTSGVANNVQVIGAGLVASNAITDGYFFGYNGTSFGIAHYVRSVATWIAQGSWNGDKVDGSAGSSFTYDPTKGTPVMIKYPYLGYGDILFFAQNPITSAWVLVHTIRYANTVATTQLQNPALNVLAFTANAAAVSNMTMYMGSVGAFVSGTRSFSVMPIWTADSNKATITTETNLISLRNSIVYNTVTNRALIRLTSVSLSSSAANGIAIFRFKIDATVGGSPSFTTINGTTADNGVTITSGNSVTSYDTAGTTISGGTYVFSITVDNPGSQVLDLTPYDIYVSPAEILTISGFSTISATLGISVNFTEDI